MPEGYIAGPYEHEGINEKITQKNFSKAMDKHF